MKAILEFDLNNPDDKMEHMRCVKATDMALALWDIQVGNFRKSVLNELEVMDEKYKTSAEDGAHFVLDRLIEWIDRYNVDTVDMIN